MTTRNAPPNYETDIKPLFRKEDVAAMSYWADLSKYSDVKLHAKAIFERVADGSMPCDQAWEKERVDLFQEWMNTGMLERDPGPTIEELTLALRSERKRNDGGDQVKLLKALQAALELELATMPLYMTAYWSIKTDPSAAADAVHEIFKDEMWHLANVCNILAGLGGTPKFVARAPKFPGPLPAKVHPRLRFSLDRLTPATLRSFMELEHPAIDVVTGLPSPEASTVGAFYEAIAEALDDYSSPLDQDRQLGLKQGPQGSMPKFATAADAASAIRAIAAEGEGTTGGPKDPKEKDNAHFYTFGEIYYGRKLQSPDGGKTWSYSGAAVAFPETYPVAEVPAGGWGSSDVDAATAIELANFDTQWTKLLTELEKTWAGPEANTVAYGAALSAMRLLEDPALKLVTTPMLNGRGNCAPCFRIVPLAPPAPPVA